jgi:hypothetical protein
VTKEIITWAGSGFIIAQIVRLDHRCMDNRHYMRTDYWCQHLLKLKSGSFFLKLITYSSLSADLKLQCRIQVDATVRRDSTSRCYSPQGQ